MIQICVCSVLFILSTFWRYCAAHFSIDFDNTSCEHYPPAGTAGKSLLQDRAFPRNDLSAQKYNLLIKFCKSNMLLSM